VRHCLEKNTEERFQSARDVAFDLESLSGLSAPAVTDTGALPGEAKRLGGLCEPIAREIQRMTGKETRSLVLPCNRTDELHSLRCEIR